MQYFCISKLIVLHPVTYWSGCLGLIDRTSSVTVYGTKEPVLTAGRTRDWVLTKGPVTVYNVGCFSTSNSDGQIGARSTIKTFACYFHIYFRRGVPRTGSRVHRQGKGSNTEIVFVTQNCRYPWHWHDELLTMCCSLYSGWLWSDVFVRSTRCVAKTTQSSSRRRIRVQQLSPHAVLVPPRTRLPTLAHRARFTKHRTATSFMRRPLTLTTVAPVCRATWPNMAPASPGTGLTSPSSPFHRATKRARNSSYLLAETRTVELNRGAKVTRWSVILILNQKCVFFKIFFSNKLCSCKTSLESGCTVCIA